MAINRQQPQRQSTQLSSRNIQEGYVYGFLPNFGSSQLIDNNGDVYYDWGTNIYSMYNSNVLPNKYVFSEVDAGGGNEWMNLHDDNGNLVWTFGLIHHELMNRLNDGLIEGPLLLQTAPEVGWGNLGIYGVRHHDAWPLLNGNILIHGYHTIGPYDVHLLGFQFDTSSSRDYAWVMEIEPTGVGYCEGDVDCSFNVVWEWYMIDHIVQDNEPQNPWNYVEDINQNLNKLDIDMYGESEQDRSHVNTIHYNPELDQVLISARGFDEFYVIQRYPNQNGGEIIFRCCQPEQYGATEYDWGYTRHQHGVNWIPPTYPDGGDMLVYNNESGFLGSSFRSSVLKISPEMSNGNYAIETINGKQRYRINTTEIMSELTGDGTGLDYVTFYCPTMSGVFMLPNGNLWLSNNPTPAGCSAINDDISQVVSGYTGGYEISDPWDSAQIVYHHNAQGFNSDEFVSEGRIVKYVPGCTDPNAINFDPVTHYMYMIDDGSCYYEGGGSGDVNFDLNVDILDVITIVNSILGNIELTTEQIAIADVNGDGNVDINDVITLINIILGSYQTTSSEHQELQRQLGRLNGRTTLSREQSQTNIIRDYVQPELDYVQPKPPDIKPKPIVPEIVIPDELDYIQTSTQAFYLWDLKSVFTILRIKKIPNYNYWLVAECNDMVVGYELDENKNITTCETMGVDNINGTENYCQLGQIPNFYILNGNTNEKYELNNYNISPWAYDQVYQVNT